MNTEKNIFTGATFTDNEGDYMEITIQPNGTIYGQGYNFDFERETKSEAAKALNEMGYTFLG